jgi:hypothetical protein
MSNVLEIRPAQREGARLVIGLAGVSGSGKTYTAIELAYGLADYDATKIGFIDTENRRGSLYADILQNSKPPTGTPFMIGDLVAPFSPQRYIDAINDFAKTGIEVLVIDSITHEHEGAGGLLEIAGQDNKYWNRAKAEHKRFVNALLQSDMHVIVCVRAREKISMDRVRDDKGNMKTDIQDVGLQPITEKNLMFEMSASLMMHDEGARQTVLKCPAALASALGRKEGYITALDGKCIRDWVDGAKQLDPTVEKFRNRLISVCEKGAAYVESAWSQTPAAVQAALGSQFHATLTASASAYDKARADAEAAPDAPAHVTAPTGATAAVAAAASAGRAARTEPAKFDPPAEATKEKPAEKPPAAKPADTNVTALRGAAAGNAKLPLATPPAPAKPANLAEPMFMLAFVTLIPALLSLMNHFN